jgi:hypothetical protein
MNMALGMEHKVLASSASCGDCKLVLDACLEVPGFINIHENGLVRHAGSSSFIVRAIVVVRDDT